MRVPPLLIASIFVLSTGCSERQTNQDDSNAVADAVPVADAAGPAADFRTLAECTAKMEAVARLYSAIASQSSGEQATEMSNMSSQRGRAAFELRMKAEDAERASASSAPGAAPAGSQVPRIIEETATALEAERARQPFEDFAIWLGREADRCAPLVPPGT